MTTKAKNRKNFKGIYSVPLALIRPCTKIIQIVDWDVKHQNNTSKQRLKKKKEDMCTVHILGQIQQEHLTE